MTRNYYARTERNFVANCRVTQKLAATDERLINSHRIRGLGNEMRVNERKREETRGEFRIYSAYDL